MVLSETDWQQSTEHINCDATLTLNINVADVGNAGFWPKGNSPETSLLWLKNNLENCGIELVPGSVMLTRTSMGLCSVKKMGMK